MQWSKWCNGGGYVKTDFGKSIMTHYYNDITVPSLWINATDDDIANNKNVKDMMYVYSNSSKNTLTLNPKEYELKEIGHMKFFSRKNKVLWQIALDWFDKHNLN